MKAANRTWVSIRGSESRQQAGAEDGEPEAEDPAISNKTHTRTHTHRRPVPVDEITYITNVYRKYIRNNGGNNSSGKQQRQRISEIR